MTAELSRAQREAILTLKEARRAASITVERDDPHDNHVFVCFYAADGSLIGEDVVDVDGSVNA